MLGWFRWFLAKNGVALSVYMLGAVALWVIVMIVLPQLFMLDFSFRHCLADMRIIRVWAIFTLHGALGRMS